MDVGQTFLSRWAYSWGIAANRANALGIYPVGGIVASILVAIVGAIILIWLSRLVKRA